MTATIHAFRRPQAVVNTAFAQDAADLFSGRRAGHMSGWLYSTPNFSGDPVDGAGAWTRMIADAKAGSDYYVFAKERAIIADAAPQLGRFFTAPTRLIDLGPGSPDAVYDKIFPFLNAHKNIAAYTGVDLCTRTLDGAKQTVAAAHPHIHTHGHARDFINDHFAYGDGRLHDVAVLFGLTLCNMAIHPRDAARPRAMLASYFWRLRTHFSHEGGTLVITQDINNDAASLARAYCDASYPFLATLPHRIARDSGVQGDFDAGAFTIGAEYFPASHACSLYMAPRRAMRFDIAGTTFNVQKGERFYFHNAFKFDLESFVTAAQLAGFTRVHTQRQDGNSCLLHVFKAD